MTSSPLAIARAVSILCWVTVGAVLVRIASGGGSLGGVGYVLATEPRLALAAGGLVLATSVVVCIALLQRRPWAWRVSGAGAAAALVGSLVLVADDHASGLLAAAAAAVALAIAVPMARHTNRPG